MYSIVEITEKMNAIHDVTINEVTINVLRKMFLEVLDIHVMYDYLNSHIIHNNAVNLL